MTIQEMLFPIISVVWLVSEILLAKFKFSTSGNSSDKSTLKLLWTVIGVSIFLGILIRTLGLGSFSSHVYFIYFSGLILIVLGLVIRWIAILTLKQSFTVDVSVAADQSIVDSGIYRHVRHPAYLGSLLSFLGLGLALVNWLSVLIIFVPIFIAFSIRINVEENVLKKSFGKMYVNYCNQTKRLIPGIY